MEAVRDGYNGYRIPLGDVDAFRNAIRDLGNKPEMCVEMGKNARKEYIEKYIPADNYRQLLSIDVVYQY